MTKKKVVIMIHIILIVIASSLLIYFNLDTFVYSYKRLVSVADFENFKNYFELKGSNGDYTEITISFIERVKDMFNSFLGSWSSFFNSIKSFLNWFLTLILYILQYSLLFVTLFILIMAIFYLVLTRTTKKYNYSFFAIFYMKLFDKLHSLFKFISYYIKKYLLTYKKVLVIGFLLLLLSSSFLVRFIIEVFLFIMSYFRTIIFSNIFDFFSSLLKWALVQFLNFRNNVPLIIRLLIYYCIFFFVARASGYSKLNHLHAKRKAFVKYHTGQTTIINGAPGTGKTVSVVGNALIAEEIYIDELESNITDFSINNPRLNMAIFRLIQKIDDGIIDYEKLSKKTKKLVDEYRPAFESRPDYYDLLESYDKLNNRDGYIVSNFSIRDPYFNGIFSHKLFMESLRLYQKQNLMFFESYMILAITEMDKEFNSHDDKKEVKDEGVAAAFGLISQATDRKVKIFCDYQCKDQLIKRVRANSESFIVLRKIEIKCTSLIKIFKKPFDWFFRFNLKLLKMYEGKKPYVSKNTSRKGLFKYYRNDYTAFYGLLRFNLFVLNKVDNYFSRFYYMVHQGELANNDEMKDSKRFITYTNIRDLSYNNEKVFDSCMFGVVYDDLKEIVSSDKYLRDIPHWSSISPSLKEYQDIDMRFYNKIFDAQNDDNESSDMSNDDNKKQDFIEL